MKHTVALLLTHVAALAIGFVAGLYFLPILTAPPAPDAEILAAQAQEARYSGELTRDLAGSDALHWGEGTISVTPDSIVHQGELSPGPDYRVYLVNGFVEDEESFEAVRENAVQIGEVESFDGFLLDVPAGIDIEAYDTVLVWCESFGEFITAARYQ